MNKGTKILLVFVIVVIIAAGWMYYGGKNNYSPDQNQTPQLGKNVIEMTSEGFNPKEITISVGETVDFVNKDTKLHWPASAMHPSHDVYPEKGGCISSAFDACRGLKEGEVFSFTFNYAGEWNYHDHLNPTAGYGFGKIIVKDVSKNSEYSIDSVLAETVMDEESGQVIRFSWKISGEKTQINHTAIHYDFNSHPGNFGSDITPQDAGYQNLTSDFASGNYEIPDEFEAKISPNQIGTLYYRAHAIIGGNNYWSDEKSIIIGE